MKFFSAATLLIAALVSAIVCAPFMDVAKTHPHAFVLQVRLTDTRPGHVQVYFDAGTGFSERDSSIVPLKPSAEPVTYNLALPPGTFRQLRFDPIDSDGTVTVASLRVITPAGQSIRELPLTKMEPAHDIAGMRPTSHGMEIVPTKGTNDPQLLLALEPPLVLATRWNSSLGADARRFAVVFGLLAAALFVVDRFSGVRRRLSAAVHWTAATPRRAVWVVAAVAVVASSYPVVFQGKSYVSPNIGTTLLYQDYPTLPGYTDTRTGDGRGSDVGAVMWQQVPLTMVEARAVRHGELPLWNRYNSAGTPLLGQGQSMFGDPLHLIVILANSAAWAWDVKYLVAKWLFAAALGLLVGRLVGAERPGAAALPGLTTASVGVAAAAPFIGFFLYRFNHPAFFSLCYAPWALYCWLGAVQARSVRATAAWAAGLMLANLALMNSGTAKEAYLLLLTMNLAGLGVLLTDSAPWRTRVAKLALLAWAGVLFALITAPVWGTFLHELHNAYTSYNSAAAYQIQPALLIGLFDEIFYRPLMPHNETFNPSLNFLLLLGFLYFLATLRRAFAQRAVITLAAVSLLPLSLAFGVVPPDWIARVPFLGNVIHIDNTFSCSLLILWAALAGVGFARAAQRLGTADGRGDLLVVGLLYFGLVFAWIGFGQAVHRPTAAFTVNQLGHPLAVAPFIWGYLAALVAASIVLGWLARRVFVRRVVTPAAGLGFALCAVVLCWRHGLQPTSIGFEDFVLRPTQRAPLRADSPALAFVHAQEQADPARVFGIKDNLFPGWNAAYGLEAVSGPDALMSPRYRELVGAMAAVPRIWDWRIYLEDKDVVAARRFLDALNVRHYVDVASADPVLPGAVLPRVKAADLDVYESRSAWPRAFFTDRLFAYDDVGALAGQIEHGDGRPFAAVQRVDLPAYQALASVPGALDNRIVVPAAHYRLSENTTAFEVRASGAGAVVLLEAWWPGDIRASVNGHKVPVLRLNHAFSGIAIPAAGAYHVEFRYVPRGWYRNVTFCVIGLLLCAGSGAVAWKRRGETRRGHPDADPARTAAAHA